MAALTAWDRVYATLREQIAWQQRRERWQPRPEQVPPEGDWRTFLFLAGRGAGKTRAAAEWIHTQARQPIRIAIVARTAADARDVCVEGESGILRTAPPWARPTYEPSKRRLTWPSGATATVFSADEPDLLRGPQFHAAWCLTGDTEVLMADGSSVEISRVVCGDMVATMIGPREVIASALTRRGATLYEMTTECGTSIVGTADHPILTNSGYRPIAHIEPGTTVYARRSSESVCSAEGSMRPEVPTANGVEKSAIPLRAAKVKQVKRLSRRGDVYDIAVDGAGHFVANGLVVHNCDELAAWNRPEDTWSNLDMAMRLGDSPRVFVSTTPRPLPLVKRLMADPRAVVVRGRTIDNTHLPASTIAALQARYGGTRLGRQELEGEILDDAPGALWRREWIEQARVTEAPALSRVVVAVDPSVTSGEDSDETGVVVCGIGEDGDGYVLADYSRRCTPGEWARQAATAYGLHRADAIVCEVNQGGDLVTESLRQVSRAPVIPVRATRGKQVRAQPLSLRYEQLRVHHFGVFPELEDQLCSWDPLHSAKSPDRLDALVWGFAHLLHLFDDPEPAGEALPPEDQWEEELIRRSQRQWWE